MGVVSRCFGARRVLRSGVEANNGLPSYRIAAFSSSLERRASPSRAPVGFGAGVFGYARICSSVGVSKNGHPLFARELPSERKPVYTSGCGVLRHLSGVLFDNPLSMTGTRHPSELHNMLYRVRSFASTSARDMTESKPVGGIVKHIEMDTTKKGKDDKEIADTAILYNLVKYLWLKDSVEFRLRVVMALALLVGAKVINVQVPFLFKVAVDWLSATIGSESLMASFTEANATLLAFFVSPAAILLGYGIARAGASAFTGILFENCGLLCFLR